MTTNDMRTGSPSGLSVSALAIAVRQAPTVREAADTYAHAMRVRRWDRTIDAGWVPAGAHGRMRRIEPAE